MTPFVIPQHILYIYIYIYKYSIIYICVVDLEKGSLGKSCDFKTMKVKVQSVHYLEHQLST